DAPLAEAMRFLSRTHFTGRSIPKEASKTVRVWHEWITDHLGDDALDQLKKTLGDQEEFAKLSHRLIEQMDMAPHPADMPPAPAENDGESDNEQKAEGADNAADDGGASAPPPSGMMEDGSAESDGEDEENVMAQELQDPGDDGAAESDETRRNAPNDPAANSVH